MQFWYQKSFCGNQWEALIYQLNIGIGMVFLVDIDVDNWYCLSPNKAAFTDTSGG